MKKLFILIVLCLSQVGLHAQKLKCFYDEGTKKYGFKNETGKIVVEPRYNDVSRVPFSKDAVFKEGLCAVNFYDKWGFIDETGAMAIGFMFDNVSDFYEGMALVKTKASTPVSFIDKKGKQKINLEKYSSVNYFSRGYSSVSNSEKKWGFIDKTGKEVIPLMYSEVRNLLEGSFAVKLEDKWGFIDEKGKTIIPLIYAKVGYFNEGLCAVQSGDKWGFINENGNVIIPFQYGDVNGCSDGMILVRTNEYRPIIFIDKTGKEIIKVDKYKVARDFRNGASAVFNGQNWGFIDKTGKEFIPLIYTQVGTFVNDTADVQLNGEKFKIDKTGTRLQLKVVEVKKEVATPVKVKYWIENPDASCYNIIKGNKKYDKYQLKEVDAEMKNSILTIETPKGFSSFSGENCLTFQNSKGTTTYAKCGIQFDFKFIKAKKDAAIGLFFLWMKGSASGAVRCLVSNEGKFFMKDLAYPEKKADSDLSDFKVADCRSFKPNEKNTFVALKDYEDWTFIINGDTVYRFKETDYKPIAGVYSGILNFYNSQTVEITDFDQEFCYDKIKEKETESKLKILEGVYSEKGSGCNNAVKDFALSVKVSTVKSVTYLQLIGMGDDGFGQEGIQVKVDEVESGKYVAKESLPYGRTGETLGLSKNKYGIPFELNKTPLLLKDVSFKNGVCSFTVYYESEGEINHQKDMAGLESYNYKSFSCNFSGGKQ